MRWANSVIREENREKEMKRLELARDVEEGKVIPKELLEGD